MPDRTTHTHIVISCTQGACSAATDRAINCTALGCVNSTCISNHISGKQDDISRKF